MTLRRLAFRAPGAPVVVAVGPAGAVPVVEALFPDDRVDDPGTTAHLTLAKEEGGFALRGPGGSWRAPDLGPLLVQVEMALAEELVRRSGLAGLHAGGVGVRGGALLLPGDGGSGKSSLTAALALRGCPVLGDDVVLLDGRGWAHPFRRLLKVEEPARTLLGLPEPSGPLAAAWPDAAFYRPAELGSRWAEAAPVQWVVTPRRVEGVRTALSPVPPARLLPGAVARLVLRDRVDADDVETVARALEGARCLELTYGTTPEGAEALLEALG